MVSIGISLAFIASLFGVNHPPALARPAAVALSSGDHLSVSRTFDPEDDPGQRFSEAIEGNSFFIEEAYNQEKRRVHHMLSALDIKDPGQNFAMTFGQEWPVGGLKHQLSYEISYASLNSGTAAGLQDSLIDYRYQLFGKSDWAAVSPRVSIILPTGRVSKKLGSGFVGFQFALPVSKRLSEHWVVHANAGWTILPRAKGPVVAGQRVRDELSSFYYGGSVVWLIKPTINLLLECLATDTAFFSPEGADVRLRQTFLSPGFRGAINLGATQIVPGLAAPLIFASGKVRLGIFLYLAVENPY